MCVCGDMDTLPDEVLDLIIGTAYADGFFIGEMTWLFKLRLCSTQFQRVVNMKLCTNAIEYMPDWLWSSLNDESLHLFSSIECVTLSSHSPGKKRGATIAVHLTKIVEITFECPISESLLVGLIDEMPVDSLLHRLPCVKQIDFSCHSVPSKLIGLCPSSINTMLFRDVSDISMDHFLSMRNLTSLSLKNCSIKTDFHPHPFATLCNLETLEIDESSVLDGETIRPFTIAIVEGMPNLRSLTLRCTESFDDETIRSITRLESLAIDEYSATLTDETLRALCNLTDLAIMGSIKRPHVHCVTDNGIMSLTKLISASFINLHGVTIACLDGSRGTLKNVEFGSTYGEACTSYTEDELVDHLAFEFPVLTEVCIIVVYEALSFLGWDFQSIPRRVLERRRSGQNGKTPFRA